MAAIKINANSFMFQFQYGAIKSGAFDAGIIARKLFQFQYGAIKSKKSEVINPFYIRVSIPVWCD